jgi:hypothetical protein
MRRSVMGRMVVGHRVVVPGLRHRLVCGEGGELRVDLVVCVHLMLGHRRRLGQRRMCCHRRGGVSSLVGRCLGLTSIRLAAGGVVILAVVMVVIEALRQGFETERVGRRDSTIEAAQHQLDVVLDLARCGVRVRRRLRGTTGVEREVVVKRLAANGREINPDLVVMNRIDRVGEVDLVRPSVDAVLLGRDLECDSGVLGGSVAPAFLIPAAGRDRYVAGGCRADTRDRPNVDWMRALVGDDGFGAGESHEGAQGENAASHDGGRARR